MSLDRFDEEIIDLDEEIIDNEDSVDGGDTVIHVIYNVSTIFDLQTAVETPGATIKLTPPANTDNGEIPMTTKTVGFDWFRLAFKGEYYTYSFDTTAGWAYEPNPGVEYKKPQAGIPESDLSPSVVNKINEGDELPEVRLDDEGKLVMAGNEGYELVDARGGYGYLKESVTLLELNNYSIDFTPDPIDLGHIDAGYVDGNTWRIEVIDNANVAPFPDVGVLAPKGGYFEHYNLRYASGYYYDGDTERLYAQFTYTGSANPETINIDRLIISTSPTKQVIDPDYMFNASDVASAQYVDISGPGVMPVLSVNLEDPTAGMDMEFFDIGTLLESAGVPRFVTITMDHGEYSVGDIESIRFNNTSVVYATYKGLISRGVYSKTGRDPADPAIPQFTFTFLYVNDQEKLVTLKIVCQRTGGIPPSYNISATEGQYELTPFVPEPPENQASEEAN